MRKSPSIIHPLDIQRPLNIRNLFPAKQPVELELGSGDGSFITHAARTRPQHNFIAVERLLGRLRKIEKIAERENLSNLRGMRIEIGYLLQFLVPQSSIHTIHVYFPDPWPKNKHERNRLFRPHFTRWVARILQPDGHILIRTDDPGYFSQVTTIFTQDHEFDPIPTPDSLKSFRTEFEIQWNAMGIPTNYAAYRRIPANHGKNGTRYRSHASAEVPGTRYPV